MGKGEDDRCAGIFFLSFSFLFVFLANTRSFQRLPRGRKKKILLICHTAQSPRSPGVFLWLHACFYGRGDLQVYLIWSLTRLKEMLISGDRLFFSSSFSSSPGMLHVKSLLKAKS